MYCNIVCGFRIVWTRRIRKQNKRHYLIYTDDLYFQYVAYPKCLDNYVCDGYIIFLFTRLVGLNIPTWHIPQIVYPFFFRVYICFCAVDRLAFAFINSRLNMLDNQKYQNIRIAESSCRRLVICHKFWYVHIFLIRTKAQITWNDRSYRFGEGSRTILNYIKWSTDIHVSVLTTVEHSIAFPDMGIVRAIGEVGVQSNFPDSLLSCSRILLASYIEGTLFALG